MLEERLREKLERVEETFEKVERLEELREADFIAVDKLYRDGHISLYTADLLSELIVDGYTYLLQGGECLELPNLEGVWYLNIYHILRGG